MLCTITQIANVFPNTLGAVWNGMAKERHGRNKVHERDNEGEADVWTVVPW